MPPEQNLAIPNPTYAGNVTQEVPPRVYGYVENPPTVERENIIRTITIRQFNYGYAVEVGCQTFAIETASNLIAKLSEYILNPNATEQKHKEGKLF